MVFHRFSQARRGQHLFAHLGVLGLLGLTLILILAASGDRPPVLRWGRDTDSGIVSVDQPVECRRFHIDQPTLFKMFAEYPNAKCGLNVNYQSVGSGAGINELPHGHRSLWGNRCTRDRCATRLEYEGPVLHIPATIGAVAISYNLSGVSGHLNLAGPVMANVYLGTVKYSDDASITALNPRREPPP